MQLGSWSFAIQSKCWQFMQLTTKEAPKLSTIGSGMSWGSLFKIRLWSSTTKISRYGAWKHPWDGWNLKQIWSTCWMLQTTEAVTWPEMKWGRWLLVMPSLVKSWIHFWPSTMQWETLFTTRKKSSETSSSLTHNSWWMSSRCWFVQKNSAKREVYTAPDMMLASCWIKEQSQKWV